MADPLQKLFGSAARLKLLRLFLFNPKDTYTVPDAAYRSRVPERTAHKELALFSTIGLIKRSPTRSGSGVRYSVNEHFEYVAVLQNLLINAPARAKDIYETIRSAGAIKLIVVAGVFVGDWEGRLDVLVVADRLKERVLRTKMRTFESEIGRELRYAMLAASDFGYRLNMNDKLVRDVMDYPHRIVFDRLNIGLK
ncbi:hypothetical protein A3D70_01265 [Candidatus Adlerbacteria bacterium RIFCSPHIGHO2_02_FULL_54_18]|uniref:HTH arsR-type domain-containing protein n=2 Tax=Candidatus Adleribacteriota TaxID=1752736 RepID=A0A1F4Y4Z7_9BACT|nr:MAG: hypothetical protein A2949_02200 [Candidatus Adlerbacteria bacterium RIFCSPLOWO2_01_FULL_54_21b]OGC89047.1 MAG: hypothetical protein A3D70_01265 [Candidatus Adlerbacteria bacterium RIFCSPHIGHO2_02_FULL_54_18]